MKGTKSSVVNGAWKKAGKCLAQSGFTLIELMVTISIMAILLMIAVPSFQNATLGSKLSSFANNLVSSAHLARSEAIKRNADVTLCVSNSDGTDCGSGGWEQGWIVLSADGIVIQHQQALPAGLKVIHKEGANPLVFRPSGISDTYSKFKVCRLTPTVGVQEREVTVSQTGRPGVTKTTTGSCS